MAHKDRVRSKQTRRTKVIPQDDGSSGSTSKATMSSKPVKERKSSKKSKRAEEDTEEEKSKTVTKKADSPALLKLIDKVVKGRVDKAIKKFKKTDPYYLYLKELTDVSFKHHILESAMVGLGIEVGSTPEETNQKIKEWFAARSDEEILPLKRKDQEILLFGPGTERAGIEKVLFG